MDVPSRLCNILTDVTLREGSQQEADLRHASIDSKRNLIAQSIAAGTKNLEVTAFAPGSWFEDAEALAQVLPESAGVNLRALYFNAAGLEKILKYPRFAPEGIFHTAATKRYRVENYNQASEEVTLEKMQKLMNAFRMRNLDFDTLVISTAFGDRESFLPEDEFLNLTRRLCDAARAQGFEIKRITVADTCGVGEPKAIERLFHATRQNFPKQIIRAHLHAGFRRAGGAILAALQGGAQEWEASWGGIGGSPHADSAEGNIDIRCLIKVWQDQKLEHGFNLIEAEKLLRLLKGAVNGREVLDLCI